MSMWIIEPREPLIFRDGRPFNANPGANANSLSFPFPSTTTGAARTRAGLDEHGTFVRSPEEVLQLKVRGPLLVQLPEKSSAAEKLEWLAPAPADALLLKRDEEQQVQGEGQDEQKKVKADLRRLLPLEVGDSLSDLEKLIEKNEHVPSLLPVGLSPATEGKPIASAQAPAYWKWSVFEKWLLEPQERPISRWEHLGIRGLPGEQRVHIAFNREEHAAKDEALFETNSREFMTSSGDITSLRDARQLALAVIISDDVKDAQGHTLEPRSGFANLGGERRIVYWRRSTAPLPRCPDRLAKQVAEQQACRIILLTPAYFEKGCYPGSEAFRKLTDKVTLQVRALAVERHQVISGWDLAHKDAHGQGRPRPTRRLVPAGSVLFLKLDGKPKFIEQWVKSTWLQCIGDDLQYCNDGFGLAVIGTWDGNPRALEIEEQA